MLKARKLRPGDKVAAVSPSWGGPGTFPARYQIGKQQLQAEFGLEVVEARHALADPDWLYKHPEARADDLMDAFADPTISAIITTIGGDDSIRLLRHLDLAVIRAHPKVFLGFSDTTVTHLACFTAGLTSFYGPSIMAGFAENGGIFSYTADSVRQTLFSSRPPGLVPPNLTGWTVELLDWAVPDNQARHRQLRPSSGWRWLQGSGMWQGRLIGGCLEVLEWLKGTAVWPGSDAWQDAILFLETSEEAPPPSAVIRALRSYAALGIIDRLAGVLFGRPGGQVPEEEFGAYDAALLQVIRDEQGRDDLPVVSRMDFGHTDPMMVLPYGVLARLDCDRQQFVLLDNAVVD
jgi:muramoyltetrapeptide carboxypeptidase LdcA involved in peptidoglycan recycling